MLHHLHGADARENENPEALIFKGFRVVFHSSHPIVATGFGPEQRSLLLTGDGFKKIIITKDSAKPLKKSRHET